VALRIDLQQTLVRLGVAWLSEAMWLDKRVEEAQRLAQQALALARERQERGYEAWSLWLLGGMVAPGEASQGTPAEALYRQALVLATELRRRPLQAHCHRSLGRLYGQSGQQQQAQAELTTADALYHNMAMTFWLYQG
jgi:tetratricopeptide (TPR) repeat protein